MSAYAGRDVFSPECNDTEDELQMATLPKTPPGLFADCEALVRFCQQNDASEMQAKAFKIEQAVKQSYALLQTLFAEGEEHVQCVDLLRRIMNDPNAVIRRADRMLAAKLTGGQS